jgi:hypothetical protein
MATQKKKSVKVRDLKPAKDAKGGVALNRGTQHGNQNRPAQSRGTNMNRPTGQF